MNSFAVLKPASPKANQPLPTQSAPAVTVSQPVSPIVIIKTTRQKRDGKVEDHLPNPFPLPQYFPATVEVGLQNESIGIISKFATCIASLILCFKQYPTTQEFTGVAQQVIEKYPWMKARLGPPTVCYISILLRTCSIVYT